MTDIGRIGLVGFGTMGVGIAQVIAQSGRQVTVVEVDQDRLSYGSAQLERSLDDGVARGKLTQDHRAEILRLISGATDLAELAGVDLVIEAVTEDKAVKANLFGRVAEIVSDATLLVTNTSALSVTDLAASVPKPERFAGLHFFNPAPAMKVVEVVQALQTDPEVVQRLAAFVESFGSTPVRVKDRPGFLVNSLLIPYLNDVIQAYDEGLASAADIDTAIRLGLGYRQGPLELLDRLGMDVHARASQAAYEATSDTRYAPPPLLQRMVAAGRLGVKSGRGFRVGEES